MRYDSVVDVAWQRFQGNYRRVSDIPEVTVLREHGPIRDKCLGVLKAYLLRGRVGKRSPLKGFLFEGPPGTGKTELAKQIARGTAAWFPESERPFLLVLDGATIAAPRWGDAEETLQGAFCFHENEAFKRHEGVKHPRVILLFDDIECLMLARSSEIAKEWHFSINAVLFHALDALDASRTFVFATTNRPKLVDEALRDRLYAINFSLPGRGSLLELAGQLLRDMGDVREGMRTEILSAIEDGLAGQEAVTIRDVERWVMMEYVEREAWR